MEQQTHLLILVLEEVEVVLVNQEVPEVRAETEDSTEVEVAAVELSQMVTEVVVEVPGLRV
jgi:hypothetical protein